MGMLVGDLTNLPEEDSNVVRIFTSSTFTDMSVERNYLMKNIYPQLRETCTELGLEFDVVDMRWGVSDNVSADHKTTELCLREISNCQRVSQGPNFITLLGDKYGYRPFPSVIPEEEYDVLLKVLSEEVRDLQLLHRWYKKDENSIPLTYILQPIHSILVNYNNPTNPSKREEDRKKWWDIFREIQELLGFAATQALSMKYLPHDICEKYLISVTESELNKGLFSSQNPSKQCACFVRILQDVNHSVDDESIKLYFDESNSSIDSYAKQRLNSLKFDKVQKTLSEVNFNCFDVTWKKGGINVKNDDHKKYLQKFSESVKSVLLNLIHEFSKERAKRGRSTESKLSNEVLHHSFLCVRKCESFHGRDNLLNVLKTKLNFDNSNNNNNIIVNNNNNVFIIHGTSGSGMSSIMAMLAMHAKSWLNSPNLIVVTRFLGTSPPSSNIREVISSLCDHLCVVYNFKKPRKHRDLNAMIKHFHQLLYQIQTPQLLILLDSVNQLSSEDNAYSLNWLPEEINKNVTIVISTRPVHGNILSMLQKRYTNTSQYLEIGPLEKENSSAILKSWFKKANRRLTAKQDEYLASCCEGCPEPIYLKLAFDQAVEWKSYDNEKATKLPTTTAAIIVSLFQRLEIELGERLVAHALGYITASKNGLSERELEDILSLDDMVLNDVYEFWDPPEEENIRVPPLIWKRIRYQLSTYLTERNADGTVIINWYQQQFSEAAVKIYLDNTDQKVQLYENISDYFMGIYAHGNGKSVTLHKRNKICKNADRLVHPQPLVFQNGAYNLRKFSELPQALINSEKQEELFDIVFFNFEWLYYKIKATCVNEVLKDMQMFLEKRDNQEVRTVHDALALSSTHIGSEKESLANQLLGTLLGFEKLGMKEVKKLLTGCRKHIEDASKPALLVRSPCMIPPGGPLQTTLQGHEARIDKVLFLDDDTLACMCKYGGKNFYVYFWCISMKTNIKVHKFPFDDFVTAIWRTGWKHLIIVARKFYYVNVYTLAVEHVVENLYDPITYVKDDDADLAVMHQSGLLCIFDIEQRKVKVRYEGLKYISCAQFLASSTEIIIGSHVQTTLDLINYKSDKVRHFQTEDVNKKLSTMLVVMANDCMLVSVFDALIKVWDITKLSLIHEFNAHTDEILCVEKMTSDLFASGSKDWTTKIWSVSKGILLYDLNGHEDSISCLKYCAETKRLVSGSMDDHLKVWNPETSQCDQTLVGHSSWISAVDVSKNGVTIVSASNDRKLKIWNVDDSDDEKQNTEEKQQPIYINHEKVCSGVAMSPNTNICASISKKEKLILWDEVKTSVIDETGIHPFCMTFNTNKMIIVGTNYGDVIIYDISKNKLELSTTYKAHTKNVVDVLMFEERIISAGEDGVVSVRKFGPQTELVKLEHHEKAITCVHISINGAKIITGGNDAKVNVFSLNPIVSHDRTLFGHDYDISSLTSSFEHVISGDTGGFVIIWQLKNGNLVTKVQLSDVTTTCLMSLPSNKIVVGCHAFTDQLKCWDIKTKTTVVEYIGHLHAVMRIRWSADYRFLFSSSRDGTIKLWDMNSGELLDSINFNAQVKFFEVSQLCEQYFFKMVVATKIGSIAFVRMLLPKNKSRSPTKKSLSSKEHSDLNTESANSHGVKSAYCIIL